MNKKDVLSLVPSFVFAAPLLFSFAFPVRSSPCGLGLPLRFSPAVGAFFGACCLASGSAAHCPFVRSCL